jgi:alkaline phosphatase D
MFLVSGVTLGVGATVGTAACSGDNADDTSSPATTDGAPRGSGGETPLTTTPPDTTGGPAETTPQPADESVGLAADPFTLGVASGDPNGTSVVLWTRLMVDLADAGTAADVSIAWEVADDEDFTKPSQTGSVVAEAAHGHAVHVEVELAPGPWYYRFTAPSSASADGWTSAIGRTMAAPLDPSTASFVTASCQNFANGYYTAYDDVAAQQPDFVMFLGDYIYEGAGEAPDGEGNVRSHETPEPTDLDSYRARYALYRSDASLQAAHAVCPWIVIWDDHEVENNYAGVVPQDPADAAGFAERRFAGYTAWWEHTPTRLPAPTSPVSDYPIYRSFTWGELLGVTLLDGRQYRDDQACGSPTLSLDLPCDEVFEADRTMLGAAQEAYLFDNLGKQSTVWNVVGQQTVFNDVTFNGAILNYDQWDGYPAARARIVEHIASAATPNVVFLTGDVHLAGIGHIRTDRLAEENLGVEFVTASISSNANVDPDLADILRSFPTFVDAELLFRGYTLHRVTADEWRAEYRVVDTVKVVGGTTLLWKTFVVASGTNTVTEA